jgi:hypothetical protein
MGENLANEGWPVAHIPEDVTSLRCGLVSVSEWTAPAAAQDEVDFTCDGEQRNE